MNDRWNVALGRGPIVLDAAMGTRLMARGLVLGDDDPAFWNLTHPDVVASIHRLDVEAGAEVIFTNTFGANRAWLSRFGPRGTVARINAEAVAIARREAGSDRFVVGSVGPTAADDPDALCEQVDLLAEHGVDAVVLETHRATDAEKALKTLRPRTTIPLWVSLIDWSHPFEPVAQRLTDLGADALGGNCQLGMEAAVLMAQALRAVSSLPILVKPSAGLPGQVPASPASFADGARDLARLAPIMMGGCCGTSEAHVAALRSACYHIRP